jgi:hypothetical protein
MSAAAARSLGEPSRVSEWVSEPRTEEAVWMWSPFANGADARFHRLLTVPWPVTPVC